MWKLSVHSLSLTSTKRIVGFKRVTLWNLFILSNYCWKWLCWVMILLVSQLGSKNTCSQHHQVFTFPIQTLLVAVIWITQRNKFVYPQGLPKDPKHFFILFKCKNICKWLSSKLENYPWFWDKLQEKISWNVHYVVNEEAVSLSCNWCLWMVASQRHLSHSAFPWPTAIHKSLQNHICLLLTYVEINLILVESNSTKESGSNSHSC